MLDMARARGKILSLGQAYKSYIDRNGIPDKATTSPKMTTELGLIIVWLAVVLGGVAAFASQSKASSVQPPARQMAR